MPYQALLLCLLFSTSPTFQQPYLEISRHGNVRSLDFSADSTHLYIADASGVADFNLNSGEVTQLVISHEVVQVVAHSKGLIWATLSGVFQHDDGKIRTLFFTTSRIVYLGVSKSEDKLLVVDREGELSVFDPTGKVLATQHLAATTWKVATNFDLSLAAFSHDGGSVSLWSAERRETLSTTSVSDCAVTALRVSHKGDFLAAGLLDGSLIVMDTKSGKMLASRHVHEDAIFAVDVRAGDQEVVSCSLDGKVAVYRLPDLMPLSVSDRIGTGLISGRWSPDGSLFVSGDGNPVEPLENSKVRFWKMKERE